MALTPAAVSNTVLFRPGVGGTFAGGYPMLAATVLAVDPTGLVLTLRVMPPDGPSVNVVSVRHVSVAGPTEQSWQYPAGGGAAGPTTVFQQVVSANDSVPGIWTPLPCLAGQLMVIEMTITNTPAYCSTEFYMGAAFPATPPGNPFVKSNGSASITPLILFTGRVGTLSVDTANFPDPTNFMCTIYSAGV